MKNFLFLVFFSFSIQFSLSASDSDFFEYDESEFVSAFDDLNRLEVLICSNPEKSYADFQMLVPNLLSPLEMSQMAGPIGIPGFWWGCFLGPIGMLIVAISNESRGNDFSNSIIGCIVGSLIWGGGWLLWSPAR